MSYTTLSLDGVEKLIELVSEYCDEHAQARLKEIARRFYDDPDFLRRTEKDDPEAVLNDLIHEINNSGNVSKFVEYMRNKTNSGMRYDSIIEKYQISDKEFMNNDNKIENIPSDNKTEVHEKEDELSNLSYPIKQECSNLLVYEKNWKNFRNNSLILGMIGIAVLFIVGFLFPAGKQVSEVPEISIPTTIVIFAFLIFAAKQQIKSEKERNNVLGFKRMMLKSYQALQLFDKYLDEEPDPKHLQSAKSCIETISKRLEWDWGPFEKFDPPFKSLKKPINDFVIALEKNFIPSFDIYLKGQIDREELRNRRKTIIQLIKFFQDDNFDEIFLITIELKKYIPLNIPKEKSYFTKLRENILVTKIVQALIGSLVIVATSIFIANILTQHPDATYPDYINWTLGISIPSLIAFNLFIAKRKT